MDNPDPQMDIIDRMADRYPLHNPPPSPAVLDRLLASHVAGSRYIFPDLAPKRGVEWTVALAGRERCNPDYLVDRQNYPFHVVELVVRGSGTVRVGGGRKHRVGPGAVFSCSSDQACWLKTDPSDPLDKYFFALAGTRVRARLTAAHLAPGTVRHIALPAEAIAVAEDLIREGQRHHSHTTAICVKLLELLLLRFEAAPADRPRPDDDRARANFIRCKKLIEERAASLQTLEELAALVHLDPSSICRLFRRFQGSSPYQELTRRKMTLAAGILLEEGGLVKEAAARVGFDDPYHFSRCFKSVHGLSPNAFSVRLGARPR